MTTNFDEKMQRAAADSAQARAMDAAYDQPVFVDADPLAVFAPRPGEREALERQAARSRATVHAALGRLEAFFGDPKP